MKIHLLIHVSNLKLCHQDPNDMQCNVIVRPSIDLSQKEDKDVEEIPADLAKKGQKTHEKNPRVDW